MNDNVIEKYESNLRELQDKLRETIYNKNMSQLGQYDPVEEEIRKEIDINSQIISTYNNIISRINEIGTNLQQVEQADIERLKDSINFDKRNLPSDLISVIDDKLSKIGKTKGSGDTIKEGSYQWYLQKRAELQKIARDSIKTTKLGMGVNRPSEEIEQQLIEINRIINTYNNLLMNIRKIKHLKATKPTGYEEEVNRLNEIIERDKKTLPEQLLEEIDEYFKKEAERKEAEKKRKKKKVLRTKKWSLTPKQKKVLIAVGIAAVVAAAVIATQALIPAMAAASHAASVSSTAATMVNNATLWHSAASIAEQTALHQANVSLATALHGITGQGAVFHASNGLWSIGGMELGAFATQAASVAAAASAKVAAISATAASLGIAGLGAIGTGIFKKNKGKKEKEENKSNQSLSEKRYNHYNEQYLEMKEIFKEKGASERLDNDLYNILEAIEIDNDLNVVHRNKLKVKVELLCRKVSRILIKKGIVHVIDPRQSKKTAQQNDKFKIMYEYFVKLNAQLDKSEITDKDVDIEELQEYYRSIFWDKNLTADEKDKLMDELYKVMDKISESKDPNLGGRSK